MYFRHPTAPDEGDQTVGILSAIYAISIFPLSCFAWDASRLLAVFVNAAIFPAAAAAVLLGAYSSKASAPVSLAHGVYSNHSTRVRAASRSMSTPRD